MFAVNADRMANSVDSDQTAPVVSGFSGTLDSASLDAKIVRRTHKNAKSRVRWTLTFPAVQLKIITNISLNFVACHR